MRSLVPATHVVAFTSFVRARSKSIKKAALLLFSVAVLLGGGAAVVRGQSALDGFDPNTNGTVYVIVVQPDGKILIGGEFTTVLGVSRNCIARLNPDGTLDTAFDPNADASEVDAIALQADGKILVGGFFTGANSMGGQTRNYIARLDATTGLADSFNPNGNGPVRSIVVQADGQILVGGIFTNIGGQPRNNIARLDALTGLADSFDPNANGIVFSIAMASDGKILAGGSFTSIGGQTRNRIARLDPGTGLADSFNPNATSTVQSIAVQADGKVLAGGGFNTIGGQPRNNVARLDATTGLADSFNPNAGGDVYAIAVQADGKILVGGAFVIGGSNYIARLDATTGLADSFAPTPNDHVYAIAVQADGKILAGGYFNAVAPNGGVAVTRNFIARWETDGRLDRTLDLNTVGSYVLTTAVQADGKILIGGEFTTVLGVTRNKIARLNSDGTLDSAFNPNANDAVVTIVVQADGKILAGGQFNGANSIGGQTRNHIARLDATTGAADSFDPNANSAVYAIAVQADGKILAGGNFITIGGQTRNQIARLVATTGLADSFDPNASDTVAGITVQADGKILVGGYFNGANSIGGQTRNRIARLDATTGLADSFNPNANGAVAAMVVHAGGKILVSGEFTNIGGQPRFTFARLDGTTGLADSFNPNPNSVVYAIAVQADGKILAGGEFTTIGGQARNRIARLDGITGLADSFDPNANDIVRSIAVQADGKILTGGFFTAIGGQTRSLFARLSNDTAALQNLAVTQNTINWIRGGSSPHFTRVTFEYSNDNLNYTPLGDGTAAGNNWILTGLSLSTGMNLYIRARGYYRGGNLTNSESITESVRNAYIAPVDNANVTVAVSPTAVAEDGAPRLVYTFTRDGVTTGPLTVNFSVAGTAAFGTDYTQTGAATFSTSSGTVTFGAGNSTAAVTIDPSVDSTVELDESAILTVTAGTGYNAGSPNAATGTIANDDTDVTVVVSPSAVAENGAPNLVYTFTRNGVTTGPLTVNFSVSGTAAFGTDYTQSDAATFSTSSGTVTFGTGNSTATVTIDPSVDLTFEPDETAILTVTAGAGYKFASPSSATGTITNDDAAGGIIKFSSASYNTTENSRSVSITVERVGDASAAVTVNYATPDDSVVPCATVNTFASPRCDFTTALGTLRFATGETSKTFTVLISQDNYVEGPETLTLTLSNLTGGAVFGVPSTAILTIDDDPTEPSTNPIDDPENFVRQHYHDFLNREPDAAGLAFWTDQITSCGADAQCIEVKRINVSASFFLSIEFQDTGYLVERIYKTAHGDASGLSTIGGTHQLAVPIVRLNEFLPDTQQIGLGVVVGQGNWEQVLENNKQTFAAEFVQRSRFTTAFPLSMTAAQFVDTLNTSAGNPLSQSERDQLVIDLGTSVKTRAQVLRAVAEDPDLKSAEFNRAFVLMQYFGYLQRNPNDPQDADYSGYDFWLTKLNQFNGSFVNAEMVKAFITSGEYRKRFGP